jgi:ankyrin repeat protein
MGKSDLVQMLLDVGFDLNRTGAWGRTLLHNAIMDDQAAIARNLLEKGAKVDKTDINGDTPLTLALQKEQRQIADVLLDMGASTRNTTVEQWRKAYEKPGHSVIKLNLEAGKTCIGFLTGNTQDAIQSATLAQSQATNLL